ncbi:UDP-N-acetylmuramoyl-tripeptide--D-alanyl-D-alanine ligase [Candidatus Nomurabacteria bacterium]|nr:UDP-N-acetylmuramoyl-tripeptide--D-alanyl-D-alanine ligase [Candidatus Nomurabacteria bacterium]
MFRLIVKGFITSILRIEARLVLKKYRPKILAITGSVGKTGAKEVIATVLATKYRVRASQKSFNSEIGVPLTILNLPNAWWSLFGWMKNLVEGVGLILFRSPYPEWLVLETGVDRPGDMRRLVKWLKPDVVVVTSFPNVPVHVEFFQSSEEVIREKWRLPASVVSSGLVILNGDEEKIRDLLPTLKCHTLTYGLGEKAQVRGSQPYFVYGEGENGQPIGLGLRVDYQGNSVPFKLIGVLGEHQLYALLAATAVAVNEGINLIEASEAIEKLETPPGRMKLLPGVKNTLIIDDTYNSSPVALASALNTLSELRVTGRKIVVLGDMLELGVHTISAHREAGVQAARVAHVLMTVGLRMKFATEEASRKKMGKKVLHHFEDAREAGKFLQEFIQEGDVVLIKGSQSLRMERAVEEIMLHPEDKGKLLVRQEEEWLKK